MGRNRIIELRCPECRKSEFVRVNERWHGLTWTWCAACVEQEQKIKDEDRRIALRKERNAEAPDKVFPNQPVTNFTTIKDFSALQVSKK